MPQSKKYTVFIAEDMEYARKLLINYLSKWNELQLEGISENGKEALKQLSSKSYDLLLLDVELPVMSGLEVLEKLDKVPYIIFTTAYDSYSIKAFEVGAVDYLVKPISQERFDQAIERFLHRKKSNDLSYGLIKNTSLLFKEQRKQRIVSYDDILFLSSAGKQTIIHTEEKGFKASNIIKELEEKLPANIFTRIHKQYIVNLKYVEKLEHDTGWQYRVILKDPNETVLPVGKDYVSLLKEKIG